MHETGASVTRWRRYGKDRLYIRSADEADLGWWDLVTDEGHPQEPRHASVVDHAVAAWKVETGWAPAPAAADTADRPPEPSPEPTLTQVAAPRPWVDLAANRAGAEVRDRAQSALGAAPVRNLLARALGVHTDERAWRIGADGEEKVGARLAKLLKKDPRWRAVHSIPVGARGSDIDHLVVGPGGVFTINTKHHPDAKIWVGGNTVLVNGRKQPYVRNARHEAARATELLAAACGFPVHVEGVIATVDEGGFEVKSQPLGVHVTRRMKLIGWLQQHGEVLDTATVAAIFEAARRSTTWRP